MKQVTLNVPDMKCEGCVNAVREALDGLGDVVAVEVSLEAKQAQVEVDDGVPAERLLDAVRAAGYQATVAV